MLLLIILAKQMCSRNIQLIANLNEHHKQCTVPKECKYVTLRCSDFHFVLMLYCFCVCVNLCKCHLVTNVTDGPQMFSVFIDTESSDLSTPEGELESQEKHIKKG